MLTTWAELEAASISQNEFEYHSLSGYVLPIRSDPCSTFRPQDYPNQRAPTTEIFEFTHLRWMINSPDTNQKTGGKRHRVVVLIQSNDINAHLRWTSSYWARWIIRCACSSKSRTVFNSFNTPRLAEESRGASRSACCLKAKTQRNCSVITSVADHDHIWAVWMPLHSWACLSQVRVEARNSCIHLKQTREMRDLHFEMGVVAPKQM